jgi:hydroxylamine reductase (hybrid-cluster protein)
VNGKETLSQAVESAKKRCSSRKLSKSEKIVVGFAKYTQWMENMSGVIDVVVQTQAGIGCPVWAPLKLVLKVG